ncbi:MAG: hypothetical protein KGN34_03985 [Sphingomonadales bacterium]|nr:hypothetical protein [Sphingomonadales bacterium]
MWSQAAVSQPAKPGFPDWLAALQAFGQQLVGDEPTTDAQLLSGLIDLLDAAPFALSLPFGVHGNADGLRAAIREDAAESMALRVIGNRAGFMISRGVQGLYFATIALPDSDVEVSSESATFAGACCKAVVLAMLALLEVHPQV